MIDVSKYVKVYEWNVYHGVIFRRWLQPVPVVFLIKIGDGYFIDYTSNLITLYEVHLNLLRKKKHPNSKMSEHFSAYRSFEVYVMEQVDAFANEVILINGYLSKYKPNMNEPGVRIGIDKSSWISSRKSEMIGVRFEKWTTNAIQELCEEHGLTTDEIVNAAVIHFLNTYTHRNSWTLVQAGITLMNDANMYENS